MVLSLQFGNISLNAILEILNVQPIVISGLSRLYLSIIAFKTPISKSAACAKTMRPLIISFIFSIKNCLISSANLSLTKGPAAITTIPSGISVISSLTTVMFSLFKIFTILSFKLKSNTLIGILFYKRIANNENAKIYLTMVTVGYFISMLFQASSTFSSRFSRFFYIFCILLIPEYLSLFPKHIRTIAKEVIVCVLIALLLYQLSINNYTGYTLERISTYWPYQTVFQVL